MVQELNYKAGGEVMHSYQTSETIDGRRLFILLVDTHSSTQPWCVASYLNGQGGRLSGHYFGSLADANDHFLARVDEAVKAFREYADRIEHGN